MLDSTQFIYMISYQGKIILRTSDIKKFNVYDSLLKQIDIEEIELTNDEIKQLSKCILRIYAEDVARIDVSYLTEQVFRYFLIDGLEAVLNANSKQLLLDIYDNEY